MSQVDKRQGFEDLFDMDMDCERLSFSQAAALLGAPSGRSLVEDSDNGRDQLFQDSACYELAGHCAGDW